MWDILYVFCKGRLYLIFRERSTVIRDSVLVIDTVSLLLLKGDSTVLALLMEILSFVVSDSVLTFYRGTESMLSFYRQCTYSVEIVCAM